MPNTAPVLRVCRSLAASMSIVVLLHGAPAAGQAPGGAPASGTGADTSHAPSAKGTVVTEVSRSCWYVFQAKNGDYWFGSDGDGVYRYDGKTIVNYTTKDGLGGDKVRGIQGDKAGNVYFIAGGICKFDGRAFSQLPVSETPADGGWRLHPDDLWFQWFKGMPSAPNAPDTEGPYRFDGTSLYHLRLPKSDLDAAFRAEVPNAPYSPNDVYSIYRDSRGAMWIGTSNFGVCRYDGSSFGWLYEEHHTKVGGGRHFGIRSVVEDKDGAFWICNTKYRFRVSPANKDGKVVYTREAGIDPRTTDGWEVYFQGAVMDAKGDLWFSPYGGGIWRWDGKNATNFPVKDGGMDTQVFSIFKDNGGGLWLGTPTAGPYLFNGKSFEQFRP